MPKLRHPASNQTIEVSPAQVPNYESQGWRKVSAPKTRESRKPASNPTATTEE